MALFTGVISNADVLEGGIRKEFKQPERKVIELPENEPVYSNGAILAYNKGIEEYKLSNYDASIDAFKSAIKQEPRFADAYFNLGILYDYFSDPKSALIAFNRAYAINKKDNEALYYIVKCYLALNDNVAGRYYFNKIQKESEFYNKAKSLFNE